jgi:hypothetical protein
MRHYFIEAKYIEEIDLSNADVREYFDYPEEVEVTEDMRREFFRDCIVPEFFIKYNLDPFKTECKYTYIDEKRKGDD